MNNLKPVCERCFNFRYSNAQIVIRFRIMGMSRAVHTSMARSLEPVTVRVASRQQCAGCVDAVLADYMCLFHLLYKLGIKRWM